MAVEQVTAFRTSGGKVFNDKNEAYQEALREAYHSLPVVGRRGYSLAAVLKFICEVEGWHDRVSVLYKDVGMDIDPAVKQAFSRLMREVRIWINQAKDLHLQMSTEPDAGIKAEIDKRE